MACSHKLSKNQNAEQSESKLEEEKFSKQNCGRRRKTSSNRQRKDNAIQMTGVRGRNAQDVTKHIIRDNIILPKKQNVISAKRLAISLWSITLRQFKK